MEEFESLHLDVFIFKEGRVSHEMEDAKKVIQEIKDSVQQHSASRKDEITVMKAMMNDPNYKVEAYDKNGNVEDYYPAKEFRRIVSNAVAATTRIPNKEAVELVSNYEFSKSDAAALVGMSKEFVHSYLQTGRKLPIGGRVTSNVELVWKHFEERTAGVPARAGETDRSHTLIPAHDGIKVSNPCPPWVTTKK